MTTENTLYYGDNLPILRAHVPDESVDLVYLDPPFQSGRQYNVLFEEKNGSRSAAQIKAFGDTWRWDIEAETTYHEFTESGAPGTEALIALRNILGQTDMMSYLAMMAPRLVELRRVLKPTGSLYLHCDPTASHYLKVLLDAIFGPDMFRNEIVWKRTSAHNDSRRFGRIHDTILFYTRTARAQFNVLHQPLDPAYVEKVYRKVDQDGRRYRLDNISAPGGRGPVYEWGGKTQAWRFTKEKMEALHRAGRIELYPDGRAKINAYVRFLDESKGRPVQDWWDDIGVIAAPAKERLGYPTQKPAALLDRILAASSNPGDTVLDPFCGCGTTVAVAQKTGRRWIGIDITHLAINLIRFRLDQAFSGQAKFEVIGEPESLSGAEQLAKDDPFQFQSWILGRVAARVVQQDKKGADRGIDGRLHFHDEPQGGATKQIVFSVKAGKTGVAHVRDMVGVVQREKAAIGVFISLQEPTGPMKKEALAAGFYRSGWGTEYPKIQLLTAEQILAGKKVEYPPRTDVTFKQAPKVKRDRELDLFED